MAKDKRIMVDMSVTLLHHGHIRLLASAKELGTVVVALTTDDEVLAHKGYEAELRFDDRKEILEAIRFVDAVVPSPWLITDAFLDEHAIDFLVHAGKNSNPVREERLKLLPRTEGISSSLLRRRVIEKADFHNAAELVE